MRLKHGHIKCPADAKWGVNGVRMDDNRDWIPKSKAHATPSLKELIRAAHHSSDSDRALDKMHHFKVTQYLLGYVSRHSNHKAQLEQLQGRVKRVSIVPPLAGCQSHCQM